MTKRRHRHDPAGGRKALAYGSMEGFGPMLNARHPKKYPPLMKKELPGATNTEQLDETPQSH